MENLTVEYIRSSKLSICYSDSEIQALINRVNDGESRVDVLLSMPRSDAIRVLAGLASPEVNVKVSACAASRANEYAASAKTRYAAVAADYAAYAAAAAGAAAAAYAAYAAAAAAAASADYAACAADYADDDELAITIRDYCRLLGWV